MFKHEKKLFHPVEIEKPNPQYAALLQEQLGGGNGELKAAMQYMSQSFRIKDPEAALSISFLCWPKFPPLNMRQSNGSDDMCLVANGSDASGIPI